MWPEALFLVVLEEYSVLRYIKSTTSMDSNLRYSSNIPKTFFFWTRYLCEALFNKFYYFWDLEMEYAKSKNHFWHLLFFAFKRSQKTAGNWQLKSFIGESIVWKCFTKFKNDNFDVDDMFLSLHFWRNGHQTSLDLVKKVNCDFKTFFYL